jgi:hypothetical protein
MAANLRLFDAISVILSCDTNILGKLEWTLSINFTKEGFQALSKKNLISM